MSTPIHQLPGYIKPYGDGQFIVLKTFDIDVPGLGIVRIYKGFIFNKDSYVPNSPDWIPSLIHDFLFVYRLLLDGRLVTRWQADMAYYRLNQVSVERRNRRVRFHRAVALFLGSWVVFYKRGRPEPIPEDVRHLYPSLLLSRI